MPVDSTRPKDAACVTPLRAAGRGIPPPTLIAALARHAAAEDAGQRSISGSVEALRAAGLLAGVEEDDTRDLATRLMRIASANLPLARLYEGHVNALRLIEAHGSAEQRACVADRVAEGAFLGVWGADGAQPLVLEGGHLAGQKTFASGLGTVTHALVTVGAFDATRMALVPVDEAGRQDPGTWTMPGMRATLSGGFDFTGLPEGDALWIGGPGDLAREPTFLGGVWRIAALQLGGAVGLADMAVAALKAAGRANAEAQIVRLTGIFMQAAALREMVFRAAHVAEGPEGRAVPERAVCLSVTSRLLTEDLGLRTVTAVERSLGLGHFHAASDTARMARDLSVYMRQVAGDALLLRAGSHAMAGDSLWDAMA